MSREDVYKMDIIVFNTWSAYFRIQRDEKLQMVKLLVEAATGQRLKGGV